MKSGYDQFFKKAQQAVEENGPLPPRRLPSPKESSRPQQKQRGIPLAEFEKMTSAEAAPKKPQPSSNKVFANQLRENAQKRTEARRKKKPFPVKLVTTIVFGIVITGAGLLKADQIAKFAHSVDITALGQAYADDKPTTSAAAPTPAADAKADPKTADVAKTTYTADDIDHFAKLNDRKKELDAREAELNRMEAELQQQKDALDKRLTELDKTRRGISSVLEEKVQADDKKVDNLVQMYSNMKPQQAAKAFEEMDEDLAIDIIGRMKKKNAAEIMNLVKPEKVKIFSEKYAGYRNSNNNGN